MLHPILRKIREKMTPFIMTNNMISSYKKKIIQEFENLRIKIFWYLLLTSRYAPRGLWRHCKYGEGEVNPQLQILVLKWK